LKKKTTQLIQHLSHEIEDEDASESYLDESLPLIGLVIMYFIAPKKSLDSMICQIVTDRADVPSLILNESGRLRSRRQQYWGSNY